MVYIFSDSSLMFKVLCSSGLTQKVQHWKLFISSLRDLHGKQFFLILPAKHKAHFPQCKNKSSHSSSSLVGTWTNFILSNCFWLAPLRFWHLSVHAELHKREWGFSDSCCKQPASFKIECTPITLHLQGKKIFYLHLKYLWHLWNFNMQFNQPSLFIWQPVLD